jgi:hypothetical protein
MPVFLINYPMGKIFASQKGNDTNRMQNLLLSVTVLFMMQVSLTTRELGDIINSGNI